MASPSHNLGGARPGSGRKKFPPCRMVSVRVPIPVYEKLKANAAREGKLFPDYIRAVFASAAGQ